MCFTFAFYWPKYAGSDAVDWALTPSAKSTGKSISPTKIYAVSISNHQLQLQYRQASRTFIILIGKGFAISFIIIKQ